MISRAPIAVLGKIDLLICYKSKKNLSDADFLQLLSFAVDEYVNDPENTTACNGNISLGTLWRQNYDLLLNYYLRKHNVELVSISRLSVMPVDRLSTETVLYSAGLAHHAKKL